MKKTFFYVANILTFYKIPFIPSLKHLDFTNYNYTKTKIYHPLQQKKKHVWKTKGKSQNSSWFSHNMNTYTPWTLNMTSHVYYIAFKYFIQHFYNHVSIPFKNFPKRLETSTEYVNFYSWFMYLTFIVHLIDPWIKK